MQIPMLAQESSWHVVLGPMVAKQSNVILGANIPSFVKVPCRCVCYSIHAVWVSRGTQKTSRKLLNKRGIPFQRLDFSNILDIFNTACYKRRFRHRAKHELSHICTGEQRSMTTFNSEMCT